MHTEVGSRHLKGATGTGACLFKYKGYILALAESVGNTRLFLCLKLCGVVYKIVDLFGSEVQKLEKMSVFEIHLVTLL